MSREMKQRAWDKDNKIMTYSKDYTPCYWGDCILAYSKQWVSNSTSEDQYILMQYTGLKDKNGVEIYEGDIVSINIPKEYCEVVFQEGAFNIVSEEMQSVDNGYNMEFYEHEGNIHENKDKLQ